VAELGGNMAQPYTHKQVSTNVFERRFDKNLPNEELVWHRDKRSRFLTVLEGKGWKFQFDNEVPKEIRPGSTIHINKKSFHRLLKGETDLVVRILEL
jgi:quercetin dioxygenase-like cupin family protein